MHRASLLRSPEYQIRIVQYGEDRSCTYGKWPNGGYQFRLMPATERDLTKSIRKDISWQGELGVAVIDREACPNPLRP